MHALRGQYHPRTRMGRRALITTTVRQIPSAHVDGTDPTHQMTKKRSAATSICDNARAARMPATIKPMLATLVDEPFSDPDWIFETKWDGFRSVCFLKN